MSYFIKKLKDAFGNLHEEIDPIRGIYSFNPIKPTSSSDNYVTVPDGKVFYPIQIEVKNTDSNTHKFHLEDDSGNTLSLEYSVDANKMVQIDFKSRGLTGKIHFVPDEYNYLVFRLVGYMAKK